MNINKKKKFSYIPNLQLTHIKFREHLQDIQTEHKVQKAFNQKKQRLKFIRSNSSKTNSEHIFNKSAHEFNTKKTKNPEISTSLSRIYASEEIQQNMNKNIKNEKNNRYNRKRVKTFSFQMQESLNKIKKRTDSVNQLNKQLTVSCIHSQIQDFQYNQRFFSQFSKKSLNNHTQRIQLIKENFCEQKLYKRLCEFSEQTNRKYIRVYKQNVQKVIAHRYGKDTITYFLGLDYVQDFDSIINIIRQMFQFKQEEIMLFCFLLFDQNRDGYITPEDMLNIAGTKRDDLPLNSLIMQDMHQVVDYLNEKYSKKQQINQKISQDYQFTKDQCLTLRKYRLMCRKRQKIKERNNKINQYISKKINFHLYTLKNQTIQNNQFNGQKKQRKEKSLNLFNYYLNFPRRKERKPIQFFYVNFQLFKKIFENTVPNVFIDFLYVLGGLELPQVRYATLDLSILMEPIYQRQEIEQQKGLKQIQKLIDQMKIDGKICQASYKTIKR